MPIFDYECQECKHQWESVEVWKSHAPKECPRCKSKSFEKVLGSNLPQVRMDPDTVLRSLPDPIPPLEELRGKVKKGCEGGYEDKPYASTTLKDYVRRKDKYGNTIWEEKRRSYFGKGMGSRKSSAERNG